MEHCLFCGGLLDRRTEGWPKPCQACGKLTYNSPKPVIALVVPTAVGGILVIKRGIEPYKGGMALPGGYIDHAEDWRAAAVREGREELGVSLNPDALTLEGVVTSPNNFLVMWVRAAPLAAGDDAWISHDIAATLNDTGEQEILGIWEVREPPKLIIPSHQQFIKTLTFPVL